ncbi:MAG: hypothetical protein EOL86_09710 [Deltaproteobacteria bacterium]|nr:hypothetical protein [Deltaproteobacteria bacterium]
MSRENLQEEVKRRGRKPLLNEQDYALPRKQVRRQPGTPMAELVRLLEAHGKRVGGTTISKDVTVERD